MENKRLWATFVILAAGAWLAYRLAVPLTADEALIRALSGLRNAENVSGVLNAAIVAPGADRPFAVRGVFGLRLPSGGDPSLLMKLAAVKDDGAAAGEGTLILLPEIAYGRMDVPGASVQDDSPEIQGRWWSLSPAALGALLAGPQAADSGAATGTTGDTSVADGSSWFRLRDLVFDGSLFAMEPTVRRERVGDVPSYRIGLGVTKSGAGEVAVLLKEATLGRQLTAEESAAARRSVERTAAHVTLWVDARSGRLLEARLDLQDIDRPDVTRTYLVEAVDTALQVEKPVPPAEAAPFGTVAP